MTKTTELVQLTQIGGAITLTDADYKRITTTCGDMPTAWAVSLIIHWAMHNGALDAGIIPTDEVGETMLAQMVSTYMSSHWEERVVFDKKESKNYRERFSKSPLDGSEVIIRRYPA